MGVGVSVLALDHDVVAHVGCGILAKGVCQRVARVRGDDARAVLERVDDARICAQRRREAGDLGCVHRPQGEDVLEHRRRVRPPR